MNKIEYFRLAHPFEPCGRVPGLGILHQRGRGEAAPSGVQGAAAHAGDGGQSGPRAPAGQTGG